MAPLGVPPFEEAARLLCEAERAIRLVERATPLNAREELVRMVARGAPARSATPRFRYAKAPDLSSLRRALERLASELLGLGQLGALFAERAAELELEARLAESVGTRRFRELSLIRWPEPGARLRKSVEGFVRAALADPAPAAPAPLHDSGDGGDPRSLFARIRRLSAELALPLRIELRPGQLATAATGDGLVAIRPGVWLSEGAGRRIAQHELLAHALPRHRARAEVCGLFRAGAATSAELEEGRAVLVETRAGLLDAERRRELALRHLASEGVRRGAEFCDTTSLLLDHALPLAGALAIAARVHRGGGLAREFGYLPAYFEIQAAFAADPRLERAFERGRMNLASARLFTAPNAGSGALPRALQSPSSTSTGA